MLSDTLPEFMARMKQAGFSRAWAELSHPITIAELEAMSEDLNIEIYGKRLMIMPPVGARHGELSMHIARHLANYIYPHGLGRVFGDMTAYILGTNEHGNPIQRIPDASFVSKDRLTGPAPADFLRLAPDLAVEILSPSERSADTGQKIADYIAAGTVQVWVVDPEGHQIDVHMKEGVKTYGEDDALDLEPPFPGLEITPGTFFADM
jgi:Uma2 family endonuclease